METMQHFETPATPEQEAERLVSEIKKVPGLLDKAKRFFKNTKNIAAFLLAMEGASMVGGSIATAAEKPKEEPEGKTTATEQAKETTPANQEDITMAMAVDQDMMDHFFGFTHNELTKRFSEGEAFSFVKDPGKSVKGVFYDRNGPAYNYELKLDDQGRPVPTLSRIEKAEVEVKKEGRKLEIKVEGVVKEPMSQEFLQNNQDAINNIKTNASYNIGYEDGKKSSVDNIAKIQENRDTWRPKMEKILNTLKSTMEIKIKTFSAIPEENRGVAAESIGRSMAIIDAYEAELAKDR